MLSSVRNYLINFGASNYNSTNEFFDAFAYWRFHCKHLPALSVSVPVVSDMGSSHRNHEILAPNFALNCYEELPFTVVFELIEKFYINQHKIDPVSTPVIFSVDWKVLHSQINTVHTRLVDIIKQEYNFNVDKTNKPREESASDKDTSNLDINKVTDKILLAVARLFGSLTTDRIDVERPLTEQGMDSLTAVSLYNWLSNEFTIDVPIAEILQGISVNRIGSYIQSKLHEHYPDCALSTSIVPQPTNTITDKTNGDVHRVEYDKNQNE